MNGTFRYRWLLLATALTFTVGVVAAVGGRSGRVHRSNAGPPLAVSAAAAAAPGHASATDRSNGKAGAEALNTGKDKTLPPGVSPRDTQPGSTGQGSSTAATQVPDPERGIAASSSTYTNSATESFDRGWYERWGIPQPQNTFVLTGLAGNYLEVRIPAGAHNGTSFLLPMPHAEAAHLRYRIRFGDTFDPSQADGNVKLPGFGNPSLDGQGSCLAGCGLAPADGTTAYSARSELRTDGVPGWYVYDVNSALRADYGRSEVWDFPGFVKTRWYTIDEYIRMNTPGINDGSLVTLVDGHQVFEGDTMLFRMVPGLEVGTAWFNVYYGGRGTAPIDMVVDLADVRMEWG